MMGAKVPLPFEPNPLGAKEGASSQPVATHSLFGPISIQPLAKSSFPLSLFLASFSFFRTRSTVALFFFDIYLVDKTDRWSKKALSGRRLRSKGSRARAFVSVRNRGYPSCPCFSCTGPWGRGHAVHTWCPRADKDDAFNDDGKTSEDEDEPDQQQAQQWQLLPQAPPTHPLMADWCRRAPRRSNPRGAPHPNARPHVKM